MSGQGNPPQGAPGRTLLQPLTTQPMVDKSGRATGWMAQFLYRIVSYIGAVPDGSNGQTLSQQITVLQDQAALATGAQGTSASTQSQLGEIAQAITILPLPPLPPESGGLAEIPALQSLEPWVQGGGAAPAVTSIYAPLVNGDLPGPTLIANGAGECIMVPIT